MEGFRIDLKTFLGLAMPNQLMLSNCQKVNIKLVLGHQNPLTFMIPIIQYHILYHMMKHQKLTLRTT